MDDIEKKREQERDGEMYRGKRRRKRLPVHTDNTESCTVEGCHLCHCAAMHQTIHCILGS